MKKGIIIQASSRSKGNTAKVVTLLKAATHFDSIDLNTKSIGHFNYEFENQNDDFNQLFKSIVNTYEILIFATPVYWYTMSGILKVFFDRISDVLIQEKEVGRKLRGKQMGVLSNSGAKMPEGLNSPFKNSAHYLGMHYIGLEHICIENDNISDSALKKINKFASKCLETTDNEL